MSGKDTKEMGEKSAGNNYGIHIKLINNDNKYRLEGETEKILTNARKNCGIYTKTDK